MNIFFQHVTDILFRDLQQTLLCEQVFLIIKRSLKRCSALSRNQTLFNLYTVLYLSSFLEL
jgi:hypothetical protein